MTDTNGTPSTLNFITLDEAAAMFTGTRVTFIPGIPALYSEALKSLCDLKGMLRYFTRNASIPEVAEVLSHSIEEHQRYILSTYCETPAVLDGDLI